MSKKGAALLTLLSFGVFSTACMTWSSRAIRSEGDYPSPGSRVVRVVKVNGEVVEFARRCLGRLLTDRVEGWALVSVEQTAEVRGPFQSIKGRADGTVSEVTDANGQVHDVVSVEKYEPGLMVIQERRSEKKVVSIPLSEVRLIKYRTVNVITTLMAVAAGAAVGYVAAFALFYDW